MALPVSAWWNSDWSYKRAIEITNSVDYNKWNVIKVSSIDFSTWGIQCTDLNDVIIVDENANVDLNRITEGTTTSTDGNIYFELANGLPAGTYNTQFYVYYGNANCPAPKKDTCKGQCDTFEDGDYTSNPEWTITEGTGAEVQSTVVKNGSYAFHGSGDTGIRTAYSGTYTDGDWIGAWFRVTLLGVNGSLFVMEDSTPSMLTTTRVLSGTLNVYTSAGYVALDGSPSISVDTWYYQRFKRNGANDWSVELLDGSESVIAYKYNFTPSVDGTLANIRLHSDADSGDTYWDDVTYKRYLEPTISLGAEETGSSGGSSTLDVNLDAPNQGFFSGLVNVQFSVYDSNNNDVFCDLNYWQTPAGSKTAILNDFNVKDFSNIASLSCTGSDLNVSGGVDCNYSWDVSSVADGNYFVDLNCWEDLNADNTDSDASDASFMVDNTAPTTTDDHNAGWQNFDANVHLTCSDGTGSGCSSTDYNIGWGWTEGTSVFFSKDAIPISQTAWDGSFTASADVNLAQSFMSSKSIRITGVSENVYEFRGKISLRDGLDGNILGKECSYDYPLKSDWLDCNFDYPVDILPNKTYYIQVLAQAESLTDIYRWQSGNPYSDGQVYWYQNGVGWRSDTYENYDASFKIFTTYDGNNQLDYNSTDVAGNVESTHTVWVAVDTTAPTISNLTPADSSRVDSNIVSWDVNDATSGVADCNALVNGSLSSDFDFATNCAAGGNGYHCSYNETALAFGSNTIQVDCNDQASNSVQDSTTFTYGPLYDVNFFWALSGALDPENGVTAITVDANANTYVEGGTITAYEWDENNALISTDENILWSDGNVGDRNFALTITVVWDGDGTTTFTDTNWQVIHISQYPQSLDFNNAAVMVNTSRDFNATATDNQAIVAWCWDFNDGSALDCDQNTTHSFSETGDYNVCFEVQDDEDLNKSHCETVEVYGSLTLHFYDETDLSTIEPTVNFQDSNYTATGGTFTYPLNSFGATSSTYTITAWDENREERRLEFDLNKYSVIEENWLLLDSDIGRSVEFQFYEPDETTLLANARVLIKLDANYIELGYLDSDAKGVFFLDTNNSNYTFYITASDGNSYTYYAVTVTLKTPKREDELNTTITPYEISVGGLARFTDENIFTDTNFYILGNTTHYYEIKVGDYNADNYFDRYYYVKVIGGAGTYTIQPYLVSASNGILSALYAKNSMNEPVPQALFVIQKQLTGTGLETVQTVVTDDTGRGLANWVVNDTYYIQVYYKNTYQGQLEVRPSLDTYYILIQTDLPTIESTTAPVVYMRYSSSSIARIALNDLNKYGFDLNLYSPTSSIQSATINVTCAGSTVYTETKTENVAQAALFHVDLNESQVTACNSVDVEAIVVTSDGTIMKKVVLGLAEKALSPFTDVKNTIGELAVQLIALLFTILAVGFVAFKVNPNPIASGILAGTILGFFTAIGWFSITLYVFAIVIGGLLAFVSMRWET